MGNAWPMWVFCLLAGVAAGEEWKLPRIALPEGRKHPLIACTPEELTRLRAAWRSTGPAHDAVAGVVAHADAALKQPVAFPPRGGQHNQWYQCETCQLGLRTIDDTHHECPRCKKVYSGEPYDDVIYEHQHGRNLSNARDAAWAYALTGERRYADYAARILLGYAERYLQYPFHASNRRSDPYAIVSGGHLFEQTLNEAESLSMTIGPACDLIWDALSEADRAAIRDGLLIPMLKNIDKYRAGKSNWQTWHNAALIAGGAVLGELPWIERAIAQPAGNGFIEQMRVSVTEDGMWYENSWGYHFYTLQAMVLVAEYARRIGIDLWTHPSLKRMFTLPVHYTMADGSLPRFGDDVQSSARGSAWLLEPAYAATRDPDLLALLPSSVSWQTILYGRDVSQTAEAPVLISRVFPGAGHAVLRTRGDAGLTACLTFGPFGGFHGHFDKLSFVFFGFREELGVDPGRAASQAYRLPIHRNWYRPTLSHNTVLVDRASQAGAQGQLDLFAANEQYAAVKASCDAAYPGTRHERFLLMTPAYLLVFDRLASDKPRRFDWVYHSRGIRRAADEAAAQPGKLADSYVGQEYIQSIKTGATEAPIRVQFPGKNITTHLLLAGVAGSTVVTGDGVGASILDRVPMVMVTRQGAEATFLAVLEPVRTGQPPAVTEVAMSLADRAPRLQVKRTDGTDVITFIGAQAVKIESNGKTVLATP